MLTTPGLFDYPSLPPPTLFSPTSQPGPATVRSLSTSLTIPTRTTPFRQPYSGACHTVFVSTNQIEPTHTPSSRQTSSTLLRPTSRRLPHPYLSTPILFDCPSLLWPNRSDNPAQNTSTHIFRQPLPIRAIPHRQTYPVRSSPIDKSTRSGALRPTTTAPPIPRRPFPERQAVSPHPWSYSLRLSYPRSTCPGPLRRTIPFRPFAAS